MPVAAPVKIGFLLWPQTDSWPTLRDAAVRPARPRMGGLPCGIMNAPMPAHGAGLCVRRAHRVDNRSVRVLVAEDDCALRTPFQRDRDRIVHSKAFRRLTHKTQVFVAPRGDHYRTRLTHTLEVTTISRTVARALRLNEDLVEAIGLGHDLGHPPFGHIGEEVLDACLKERFGQDGCHSKEAFYESFFSFRS